MRHQGLTELERRMTREALRRCDAAMAARQNDWELERRILAGEGTYEAVMVARALAQVAGRENLRETGVV